MKGISVKNIQPIKFSCTNCLFFSLRMEGIHITSHIRQHLLTIYQTLGRDICVQQSFRVQHNKDFRMQFLKFDLARTYLKDQSLQLSNFHQSQLVNSQASSPYDKYLIYECSEHLQLVLKSVC